MSNDTAGLAYPHFTHTVTLAGSGFGFVLLVGTLGWFYFKAGRKFTEIKKQKVWLPLAVGLVVAVLASACAGGLLGKISGFLTGTGNQAGGVIGKGMVGGDGAVAVSQHQLLTYSGGWIALAILVLAGFFFWFAKKLGEKLLLGIGAVVGSTWGLTMALGGAASYTAIPLANWAGSMIIG
ncbi:hypothetical protein [Kitasatospora sp. CB01950]|uniref:hypothetical protein n=1 Tax=Kitasatospora sp. CB01950 TaxID=1703930 RepID=UPI0009395791|nr:hypothetical protein [Kitasatospora sp. CB01950]OKI95082.1 hypothetical protein AMK19_32950 [Kitasatospora sp. CB01950]